jgi:hypothetical protein
LTDLSSAFTLDGAIKEAVRSLSAPGLVVTTTEDKLARVEEFFAAFPSKPSSGGVASSSASTYSDELSILVSQPPWRQTEANLLTELGALRRPLVLFELLMSSPVLGARQLALGRPLTDELRRLLSLSKPLKKAVDILNIDSVRHKLVADAFVANRVAPLAPAGAAPSFAPEKEAEINFHTVMPEKMTKAILRGAFDEIDWIQLLRLLLAVQRPNSTIAAYTAGWYDSHFVNLILPHLERMSALLGLPSVLTPGSIPFPVPTNFGSLSSIASTILQQHAEIQGVPSAFSGENLESLAKFSAQVFPEAARQFQFYYSCVNPAGPLPMSLFEDPSAACSVLSTLQKAIKHQEDMATNSRAVYLIAADIAKFGSLEAAVKHHAGRPERSSSPSPFSAEAPQRTSKSGKDRAAKSSDQPAKKVTSEDGRRGRRESRDSKSPSRDRSDSSHRSRSSDRSPSPGAIGSRYDLAVQQSADGTGFWYRDAKSGKRASPVYTYDVLEKLAGKTRHELDFPVLLSNKGTAQSRATLCGFEGKPGHEHANSSAHVFPYADFVAKVHSHFQVPTTSRASSSAHPGP